MGICFVSMTASIALTFFKDYNLFVFLSSIPCFNLISLVQSEIVSLPLRLLLFTSTSLRHLTVAFAHEKFYQLIYLRPLLIRIFLQNFIFHNRNSIIWKKGGQISTCPHVPWCSQVPSH